MDTKITLKDVLDRALDKGLVLHADVIVSVAGVPLVGVSLRAAVAGIDTMLEYGYFKEWDLRTRQEEPLRLEAIRHSTAASMPSPKGPALSRSRAVIAA